MRDRAAWSILLAMTLAWRKSSWSIGNGNCVETATAPDDTVLVRNSRHPDVPPLAFTPDEWAAFIAGAMAGEFGGGER